jgi:hypothetical protein
MTFRPELACVLEAYHDAGSLAARVQSRSLAPDKLACTSTDVS